MVGRGRKREDDSTPFNDCLDAHAQLSWCLDLGMCSPDDHVQPSADCCHCCRCFCCRPCCCWCLNTLPRQPHLLRHYPSCIQRTCCYTINNPRATSNTSCRSSTSSRRGFDECQCARSYWDACMAQQCAECWSTNRCCSLRGCSLSGLCCLGKRGCPYPAQWVHAVMDFANGVGVVVELEPCSK